MLDAITKTLIGFGVYAITVLVYTLIGYQTNLNIFNMKWNWKKWANGVVKYLLFGIEGVLMTICAYLLVVKLPDWGINASNVEQISVNVIWALTASASVAMLVKCIRKWATSIGLTDEMILAIQKSAIDNEGEIVLNLNELNELMPDDYGKKHLEFEDDAEKEGGLGNVYHVPYDTYANFKSHVLGLGFDIDNAYGWQCWDGAALLWQQMGLTLWTGNGLAIGCWDLKRDANKYDKFDLIYNANDLRVGDVVCMRPNHIGFFDGWNGSYMRILGQNQGGSPTNPAGGSAFNIVNVAKSSFAGAFRCKAWNSSPAPTPAPTPKPTKHDDPNKFKVGDIVEFTNPVDVNGTHLAVSGNYTVMEISNGSVVVGRNGVVTARVWSENIKKVGSAPKPSGKVNVGDRCKTTATNDVQTGAPLDLSIINDGNSYLMQINDRGNAVLAKDNVVRCAVPIDSLVKI